MSQCASSSSSKSTSVRTFPSNARVSCKTRPINSRPAVTSSGLNLSSSVTVTVIVISSCRQVVLLTGSTLFEPTVDPFDEVRRLRNLVRGREQVSEPLLGGHHLVIQRHRQPPEPALCQRGDGDVQTYGG